MSDERQLLVDQLIDHEGLRLKVYTDTVGVPTIGVGRNLRDRGLSREEALYLLGNDIDACILDLVTFAWFPPLDTVRQRAVIDLRFQLGYEGFRDFKDFIAAMARGCFIQASFHLDNSRWAKQVAPARKNHIRSMIETGID